MGSDGTWAWRLWFHLPCGKSYANTIRETGLKWTSNWTSNRIIYEHLLSLVEGLGCEEAVLQGGPPIKVVARRTGADGLSIIPQGHALREAGRHATGGPNPEKPQENNVGRLLPRIYFMGQRQALLGVSMHAGLSQCRRGTYSCVRTTSSGSNGLQRVCRGLARLRRSRGPVMNRFDRAVDWRRVGGVCTACCVSHKLCLHMH